MPFTQEQIEGLTRLIEDIRASEPGEMETHCYGHFDTAAGDWVTYDTALCGASIKFMTGEPCNMADGITCVVCRDLIFSGVRHP